MNTIFPRLITLLITQVAKLVVYNVARPRQDDKNISIIRILCMSPNSLLLLNQAFHLSRQKR